MEHIRFLLGFSGGTNPEMGVDGWFTGEGVREIERELECVYVCFGGWVR